MLVIQALPLLSIAMPLPLPPPVGKHVDLGRVAGRKARDGVADRIGDPDPVLLVDRQAERTVELAGAVLVGLAVG